MRGSGCNMFCWSFATGEPVALSFPDLNSFAVPTLPSIPTAKGYIYGRVHLWEGTFMGDDVVGQTPRDLAKLGIVK
jgi:hypothetical protein